MTLDSVVALSEKQTIDLPRVFHFPLRFKQDRNDLLVFNSSTIHKLEGNEATPIMDQSYVRFHDLLRLGDRLMGVAYQSTGEILVSDSADPNYDNAVTIEPPDGLEFRLFAGKHKSRSGATDGENMYFLLNDMSLLMVDPKLKTKRISLRHKSRVSATKGSYVSILSGDQVVNVLRSRREKVIFGRLKDGKPAYDPFEVLPDEPAITLDEQTDGSSVYYRNGSVVEIDAQGRVWQSPMQEQDLLLGAQNGIVHLGSRYQGVRTYNHGELVGVLPPADSMGFVGSSEDTVFVQAGALLIPAKNGQLHMGTNIGEGEFGSAPHIEDLAVNGKDIYFLEKARHGQVLRYIEMSEVPVGYNRRE